MFKNSVMLLVVIFVLSVTMVPLMADNLSSNNNGSQNGASVISDFVSLTSDISTFFGNAINFMGNAIGYLTGGIHAAHQFQSGTDIINDMLQHGPPHPENSSAPSSSSPVATTPVGAQTSQPDSGNEVTTPSIDTASIDDSQFTNLLSNYKDLVQEDRKLTETISETNDTTMKEVLKDVKKREEINKNKILFSINQDIESKEYQKLHLLVDYVNTQGGDTTKLFFEIIDETKMKLQFSLVQAQNLGLAVDIEVIEGKLALIFKLTSGNSEE